MGNWADISAVVYKDLAAHQPLMGLLSNAEKSIYQLIAPSSEGVNYITYDASYEGNPSKDGKYDFTVSIRVFAPSYKKSVEIADEVTEAIKASSNNYKIISGKPEFIEENEFYLEQIFNIKK